MDLERLWSAPAGPQPRFSLDAVSALPPAARHYFEHAIAPGTPLAVAVRLRMRGELRLKGNWFPFEAEEAMHVERGFLWSAKVKVRGLPVVGSDRWIDGTGTMSWKLLGLIPIARGSGDDISRSAAGRMLAESMWMPSFLLRAGTGWTAQDDTRFAVELALRGERARCELAMSARGALESLRSIRWGDPDGAGFREVPFGAIAEEERAFGGYTIPSRLRAGWYLGTPQFDSEGEFFRCAVDGAVYR
jgi:hypothetical protein